jgi:endonuclease YncB( thermonuclease family)
VGRVIALFHVTKIAILPFLKPDSHLCVTIEEMLLWWHRLSCDLARVAAKPLLIVALAYGPIVGCGPVESARYSRKQAATSLKQLEAPSTTIGEFKLSRVVDGDTIRVDGLDASMRLLGIDAEETFKSEADRRGFDAGWQQYMASKRGSSSRPVKAATPLGEDAKHFAEQFFAGVDTVTLERDHPAEIRDRYNRYLAYVLVKKNGVTLNYNVECVRAGMSPYFPKYGNARRYHQDFLAAAQQAKDAKRGIWAAGAMAYPEREQWWQARGEFVEKFRQQAQGKANYIDITHWDAMEKLEQLVGKPVFVLGTVGEVRMTDKGPARATLSRRIGSDFPLIFFDRDVLGISGLSQWRGEFVVVSGVPTIYENKHTLKKQVQIVVDQSSQIALSPVPGLQRPIVPVVEPQEAPDAAGDD